MVNDRQHDCLGGRPQPWLHTVSPRTAEDHLNEETRKTRSFGETCINETPMFLRKQKVEFMSNSWSGTGQDAGKYTGHQGLCNLEASGSLSPHLGLSKFLVSCKSASPPCLGPQ